jgi:disulfide bond formation protein DsbB
MIRWMFSLIHPVRWIYVALASALGLLAAAHAFETFGHMPPCELCLKQRELYWLAATVSGGAAAASLFLKRMFNPRLICLALAAVFLGEMGLAAYHVGVEWKWWPGPAACTGGKNAHISLDDLKAFANGKSFAIVRCDEPAFRFLGLSMAGFNVLIAAKLAILSLISAGRPLEGDTEA